MTRTVYVIGIGAGDPDHLTLQAVAAMNRADVFFTIAISDGCALIMLDAATRRP